MGKKITDKVTWVGKVDWELKRFHGDELSTSRGSSYNAYLVRDEKVALIDTVWKPYDKEFVSRLKQEIDLKQIDYIVMGSINGYGTDTQTIIMDKDLNAKENLHLLPEFLTIDIKDIEITVV